MNEFLLTVYTLVLVVLISGIIKCYSVILHYCDKIAVSYPSPPVP